MAREAIRGPLFVVGYHCWPIRRADDVPVSPASTRYNLPLTVSEPNIIAAHECICPHPIFGVVGSFQGPHGNALDTGR
jgi:hypothetical protein